WAFYLDRDTPRRGGRPSNFVKRWTIWRYFAAYFPVKLVKTCDLDPAHNYLFCYHPHGIISVGAVAGIATEANCFSQQFPGIDMRLGTLDMNFFIPGFRDYLMAGGFVSVSKPSCIFNLTRAPGAAMLIVIGGAQESLDAHPGTNRLTLAKRRGFIRVAL